MDNKKVTIVIKIEYKQYLLLVYVELLKLSLNQCCQQKNPRPKRKKKDRRYHRNLYLAQVMTFGLSIQFLLPAIGLESYFGVGNTGPNAVTPKPSLYIGS